MKRLRGFRVGRSLFRLRRWVRRRRFRRWTNLHLTRSSPPSPSQSSPCLYRQYHHTGTAAETTRVADWGRFLHRRFTQFSHVCFHRGGRSVGEEAGAEHGLHDRLLPQQPQRREAAGCSKAPPKGHLAVYVGRKGVEPPRRVVVPVVYFNHPLFGELLRGAEEEFGFHHPGGITIPCPVSDFESVRTRVAAAAGLRR